MDLHRCVRLEDKLERALTELIQDSHGPKANLEKSRRQAKQAVEKIMPIILEELEEESPRKNEIGRE